MCELCPEIVAYKVDADRNLVPIYGDEDSYDGDAARDLAALRQARRSALHPSPPEPDSLSIGGALA